MLRVRPLIDVGWGSGVAEIGIELTVAWRLKEVRPVAPEHAPPSFLIVSFDKLKDRGLEDLALWILDLLHVWGFVGGQLLWMLSPFFDDASLAPLARTLEQPERLESIRDYLLEGKG
jgi:hypothetical protein